jgi:hypothetical protein
VPVSYLFSDYLLTNDTDYIIASAPDGSPSVIPAWGLLKNDLYFFPNATASTAGGSVEGKTAVPAGLAIDYVTGKVNTADSSLDTAAEALSAAAPKHITPAVSALSTAVRKPTIAI